MKFVTSVKLKTALRLVFLSVVVLMLAFAAFKALQQSIVANNEALVTELAERVMPALMRDDKAEVAEIMKSFAQYPGVQVAELVGQEGANLATYVRDDMLRLQPAQPEAFALAFAASHDALHVMSPVTFDTQVVANLYLVIDVWPAYLRVLRWLGAGVLMPTLLYWVIKRFRIKLRFERRSDKDDASGSGRDASVDVQRAMHKALDDAHISVHFQPIVRLNDGGLHGAEVMVRWLHPSGRALFVSPAEFVALAEKNGLCLPFDAWVIQAACEHMALWQRQHGPLVMAMNVSRQQLDDASFGHMIRSVCASAEYPHQLITFEIKESHLEADTAQQTVSAFAAQGWSLTVDRFGVQQRSMALLPTLSRHNIKLAPELVKGMVQDQHIDHFVQDLVKQANALNIRVSAEGVDSKAQRDALLRAGCVLGQGTYFSAPLSADEFAVLLQTQHAAHPLSLSCAGDERLRPVSA